MINIKIGKEFESWDLEKGLSQEQFSYKADVHRTYIGMIERSEKNVSLVKLKKMYLFFYIKSVHFGLKLNKLPFLPFSIFSV